MKLIYIPREQRLGTACAVREFVLCMPDLEKAHHAPVRMVKVIERFGLSSIVYEVVKNKEGAK